MPSLFNRNIIFSIEAYRLEERGPRGSVRGGLISDHIIKDTNISASLSKSWAADAENSGSVTALNISPASIAPLVSPINPSSTQYSLRAGYGTEREAALISRGFVSQTTWGHEGGDTSLSFFLTEGSKFMRDPLSEISQRVFPGGSSIWDIVQAVRKSGQEMRFEVEGGEAAARQTLSAQKIRSGEPLLGGHDMQTKLRSLLNRAGLMFFLDNEVLVIRPQRRTGIGARGLLGLPAARHEVSLSFDTGLLSANIENSYDYQYLTAIPRLKFRALFIPELVPGNAIIMEEDLPGYARLKGRYRIESVNISLNNKEGSFHVEGQAVHENWRFGGRALGAILKGA